MNGLSYKDRKMYRPPKDGDGVATGRIRKERFDALVDVEIEDFESPVRVVESGAIATGKESRPMIVGDPGERTEITEAIGGYFESRFHIHDALIWSDRGFVRVQDAAVTSGRASLTYRGAVPPPGKFRKVVDLVLERKRQLVPLADVWQTLQEIADGDAFSWEDLGAAFGEGPAAELLREAAIRAVVGAIKATDLRVQNKYYTAVAGRLEGYESEDLGPLCRDIFFQALKAEAQRRTVEGLPDLVADLAPDTVLKNGE